MAALRNVKFLSRSFPRMVASSSSRPLLASTSLLSKGFRTNAVTRDHTDSGHTYMTSLKFLTEKDFQKFPEYQVLNRKGKVVSSEEPQISGEELMKWYRVMITLNKMDTLLYTAQRQGRVSFYMTAYGEEAIHVGSAAGLDSQDVIYAQYREAGVLMYRGFTIAQFMNQCYSNELDLGKGRQMPVHYGSRALNFHTISSPLTTQLPQAAGAAYALKGTGKVVMCYFGDGAASEGDFHPALNFAATLEAPVIFFCRNNGYAISTPVHEQFRGDGIASRGPGYGMATVRVDGNDALAVYNAVKEARALALQNKPVLIEAMTYRVSHHSTSDDSTRYRDNSETTAHMQDNNPIKRLEIYMKDKGVLTDDIIAQVAQEADKTVKEEFAAAEKRKKPALSELFSDVYDNIPPHLVEQRAALLEHISKYPDQYPLDVHAPSE